MISPVEQFQGLNCTINTTEDCNLRCKYCYETCKSPKTIEFDKCKKFIDLILDDPDPCLLKGTDKEDIYQGYIFDFIGGDSLMNVDILDKTMTYLSTKFASMNDDRKPLRGWRCSLSSNGTLFTLPKVREFCEKWKKSLSLGVSIDGNPEIHDANRVFPDGTGSMKTILEGWPWYQKNFPIESQSTKATCARNTIPHLYDSLVWMHEELGLNYINQNFIMEDTGCTEEDYKMLDMQLGRCVQYVWDHRNELYWSMIDRTRVCVPNNEKAIQEAKERFYTSGFCGSGCMPTLSIDGNIYPCFRWLPHTQNGQAGIMCVGNVDEGLTHKENFTKIQECSKRCNCTKDPKCLECELEPLCPYCIGGCYAEFGEFKRTTYICEIMKLQNKWAERYWKAWDEEKRIKKNNERNNI